MPHEPGWSFVIQCHALMEIAINHSLRHRMGLPEISDEIARLRIDTRLSMLNKLSTSSDSAPPAGKGWSQSLVFIKELAALRNRYAHNFRNVGRTIDEMLTDQPAARKVLTMNLPEDAQFSSKTLIMMRAHIALADLHLRDEAASMRKEMAYPTTANSAP